MICFIVVLIWLNKDGIGIKYRRLTYEDLLDTDEWKYFRSRILEDHGYRCDWCGRTNKLQVHHKLYKKLPNGHKIEPWKYYNDEVMCLCDDCHKKYHEKYKVKTYYISYKEYKNFE